MNHIELIANCIDLDEQIRVISEAKQKALNEWALSVAKHKIGDVIPYKHGVMRNARVIEIYGRFENASWSKARVSVRYRVKSLKADGSDALARASVFSWYPD